MALALCSHGRQTVGFCGHGYPHALVSVATNLKLVPFTLRVTFPVLKPALVFGGFR